MGLEGGLSSASTLALSVLRCSDKFTRFCQWKNVELNIHVSGDPCASGHFQGGEWGAVTQLLPWGSPGHPHTRPGLPHAHGDVPLCSSRGETEAERVNPQHRGHTQLLVQGRCRRTQVSRLTPPPPSRPLQLTMNDFSVHRIIGRGGFGEVYGCRKADTGKM